MKPGSIATCITLAVAVTMGCNATSRHGVLSFFFDGVPPPGADGGPEGRQEAKPAPAVESRQVGYRAHGPYAAKLCTACHESGTSNALVAPRDQICFRCHEIKQDKRYVHGPLASGGCMVCHDPHSSQYRYLLVSELDNFCLYCHDRQSVAKIGAHEGIEGQCTTCHDAHMSDRKFFLK